MGKRQTPVDNSRRLVLLFLLSLVLLFLACDTEAQSSSHNNNDNDDITNESSSSSSCSAVNNNNNNNNDDDDDDGSCSNHEAADSSRRNDTASSSSSVFRWATGTLRPSDFPPPVTFSNFVRNFTVSLPSGIHAVAEGSVVSPHSRHDDEPTTLYVMPDALPAATLAEMVRLVHAYDQYDVDPDTADGMPTYELYIDSVDLDADGTRRDAGKIHDFHPEALKQRLPLRQRLRELTQPILDHTFTPWVRQTYPDLCNRPEKGRWCVPCFSLIRHYKHGRRQTLVPHRDGQALASIVVSLSTFGEDFHGGLYVARRQGGGDREFLALSQGHAVLYRRNLLHGVKVLDLPHNPAATERFSWGLWFQQNDRCENPTYRTELPSECDDDSTSNQNPRCTAEPAFEDWGVGEQGEAVQKITMEMLQGKGIHGDEIDSGVALAAVRVGRAYMKNMDTFLPLDLRQARKYFQVAIKGGNSDGYYGLAYLLLSDLSSLQGEQSVLEILQDARWTKIIRYLERCAYRQHTACMFNLGLAHIYGYGVVQVDQPLGVEWIMASGLPEGYAIVAQYYDAQGDAAKAQAFGERAVALGYGQPWREKLLNTTDTGSPGGLPINMPWPISMQGNVPPQF